MHPPSISAASSCVIPPRSCRSNKFEKRIRRTPSCIDAPPIVPLLFRAPQTRHFTSYKQDMLSCLRLTPLGAERGRRLRGAPAATRGPGGSLRHATASLAAFTGRALTILRAGWLFCEWIDALAVRSLFEFWILTSKYRSAPREQPVHQPAISPLGRPDRHAAVSGDGRSRRRRGSP
jgi:hypothetical protein